MIKWLLNARPWSSSRLVRLNKSRGNHSDSSSGKSREMYRGRGGGRGGLRGKAIGMYYAKLSKARKEEKEKRERAVIKLDVGKQRAITDVINEVEAASCSSKVRDDIVGGHVAEQFGATSTWHHRKLTRNAQIDQQLIEDLNVMEKKRMYQDMLNNRKKLPIYAMQNEIIQAIHSNQVIVISGHTGCGKTTQLPQFILDDAIRSGNGSLCSIICTQPRRISAISVSDRVREERAEKSQSKASVGYQIRLEENLPRSCGSILYCTTGILLRRLQSDPQLSHVSHVVVDEIHERDLISDFLLICLKDLLIQRPDLKVILMSATLNAPKFSEYFNKCPIIEIPGSLFATKCYYLEDIITLFGGPTETYYPCKTRGNNKWQRGGRSKRKDSETYDKNWNDYLQYLTNEYSYMLAESISHMEFDNLDFNLLRDVVSYICDNMGRGAILCFLPGWEDIRKMYDTLLANPRFATDKYLIIPLHSQLPTLNQKKIFDRPPSSVRKIVIATNIAETSITIDDVVFVVDCGKTKETSYDPSSGLQILAPVWTSRASAQQRAGRAGRVQAGHCFYLYTEYHFSQMREFQLPEMLRTPLEELCLQIKKLDLGMISPFLSKAMDIPVDESVQSAISLLKDLNAINKDESLTPLGHHLATLPVNPRLGKIIVFGALFSCLYPAVIISAFLGFKDPFFFVMDRKEEVDAARKKFENGTVSDHLTYFNVFKEWEYASTYEVGFQFCRKNFLSENTLKMIAKMARQFCDLLKDIGFIDTTNMMEEQYNVNSGNNRLITAMLCAGLYPNVVHVDHGSFGKRNPKLSTRNERRVYFHPKSVNAKRDFFASKWLIYHQKMKLNSQVNIFDASMISPLSLLFFGGEIGVNKFENVISVDSWIKFEADPGVAELVKQLRQQLDDCLRQKIKQPSMKLIASKRKSDPKSKLLNEIINLITEEDLTAQAERLRNAQRITLSDMLAKKDTNAANGCLT